MTQILTYVMAGITLAGSIFNAKKLRIGFLFWSVTNAYWIYRNIMIGEYAQVAVYVANMCISIYGFICWGKPKKAKESDNASANLQTEDDLYKTAFDDDLFYLREEGSVRWIYYNPNSSAGGQYVENVIHFEDILNAARYKSSTDFFDCLGSDCKQWLIDIGTESFEEYNREFNEDPYSLRSADADTRERLIAFAKKHKEKHYG